MATVAMVDVDAEIKEPLGDINRMGAQLYIFGYLASVKSQMTGTIERYITDVYYSCHPEQFAKNADGSLSFKGNEMSFRITEMQHSPYMMTNMRWIQHRSFWKWMDAKATTPLTGKKLVHFGTQPNLFSRYGPVQYTIPYSVLIKRYLEARSKRKQRYTSVMYRICCSQIHKREINYMIIVCCDGDEELKGFRILGTEAQTRYFTPLQCDTATETLHGAKMLQCLYDSTNRRHQKLTLCIYLPDDCQMNIPCEEYRETIVEHDKKNCNQKCKRPYYSGECPSKPKKQKVQ